MPPTDDDPPNDGAECGRIDTMEIESGLGQNEADARAAARARSIAAGTANLRFGPGTGRPKGVPNKVTQDAREIAQSLTTRNPEYLAKLRQRLMSGKLPPPLEQMLWHYAHGAPRQSIEVTGNVQVQHQHQVLAVALRELPLDQLVQLRATQQALAERLAALGAGDAAPNTEILDAEIIARSEPAAVPALPETAERSETEG